jgi:hypothetical protein
MAQFDRKHMEALYEVFRVAALEDQKLYYQRTVERNRTAASQVNRWRAFFALLTGLSSALAGLIVAYAVAGNEFGRCDLAALTAISAQSSPALVQPTPEATLSPEEEEAIAAGTGTPIFNCDLVNIAVPLLVIVAVVAPALGGAFTTLADLYQWDRLTTVYDVAAENLEVADAQSPLPSMEDDLVYRAALRAYAEGTLAVMRDETAQWGQLINTPRALEAFIVQERAKAEAASASATNPTPDTGQPTTPPPAPPEAPGGDGGTPTLPPTG